MSDREEQYYRSRIQSALSRYNDDPKTLKEWVKEVLRACTGEGRKRRKHPDFKKALAVAEGYAAVYFGPSFEQIEQHVGPKTEQSDPTRCAALIHATFHEEAKNGSTRIRLETLIYRCWRYEQKAGVFKKKTSALYLAHAIKRKNDYSKYTIFEEEDGTYIADGALSADEKNAALYLKSIVKNAGHDFVSAEMIDAVEAEIGVRYDEYQRQAFRIMDEGVGILTGGPGTGKTTVLRGMIAAWKRWKNTEILCCAFSNTAASRMQEATGEPATTIHKMLEIYPFTRGQKNDPTPRDLHEGCLVILDEASMVDITLAAKLLFAVYKAHGQIIIVGDEDQLQSVGPGNVLHDLIESGRFEMARLQVIHRQEEDAASIAKNAARVRDGIDTLEEDDFFKIFSFLDGDGEKQALLKALQLYLSIRKANPDVSPLEIRIFTPIRKPSYIDRATKNKVRYLISATYINKNLHYHFAKKLSAEDVHHCNGQDFCAGEPVIYEGQESEHDLHNGDLGVVTFANPSRICVKWRDDVGEIELSETLQEGLALAYATSVHKAQGGQALCGIVVLPDYKRTQIALSRQMLYVAVTRAEKRCYLVAHGDAIRESIKRDTKDKRKTGLVEQLGGKRKRRRKSNDV